MYMVLFKLDLIINSATVHILIHVGVTLTFGQGYGGASMQKLSASCLTKLSVNLTGIWYAAETSRYD